MFVVSTKSTAFSACVAVTLQEVVKRFQIYRSTGSSAATVY